MAVTLQIPSIAGIKGSTLRVVHPNVENYQRTSMKAQAAAATNSISVGDNNGFSENDYIILGQVGDSKTEEVQINAAVTRGTSIPVDGSSAFAHELHSPVTKIIERQIKIYGNNSDSNSGGTLIDTINIDWTSSYQTLFTVTGTNYSYYYATFTDGTTEGSASETIPATGHENNIVMRIIERALGETGAVIGYASQLPLSYLLEAVDECQDEIAQYTNQITRIGKGWSHEIVVDETLEVISMENRYALSGLSVTPKYSDTKQAIVSIWVGKRGSIKPQTWNEHQKNQYGRIFSRVATAVSSGSTTLVLDDATELADAGTVLLGNDTITYTGKSTNTLTGIPASGTGSITETHAVGKTVWQGVTGRFPNRYTIMDGYLYFNQPFMTTYEGVPIRITIAKKLPQITRVDQATEVSFFNIIHNFVAFKIEVRRGNMDKAAGYKQLFEAGLMSNADKEKSHTPDTMDYYNFVDPMVPVRDDQYPNSTAGLSQSPTP